MINLINLHSPIFASLTTCVCGVYVHVNNFLCKARTVEDKFANRCMGLVESLGICQAGDITDMQRLTGGVASDIASVTYGKRTVCVKFALSKLQVSEDWFAPVHRNQAEYSWLQFAQQISPTTTPKLFGWSETENGFAMEFIYGPDVYLWKAALLSEVQPKGEAEAVANAIAQIHSASAKSDFDRSAFDNGADFESLRIEPYLRFTATRHQNLALKILAVADQLSNNSTVLIHGDISPKNILLRKGKPVILDAECATMGDPSFDAAFCINHLLLKSIHLPNSKNAFLTEAEKFWDAYQVHVDWEDKDGLEARIAELLPILMLARVDGKSPVEYLSEESRTIVRNITRPIIEHPLMSISAILAVVKQETDR